MPMKSNAWGRNCWERFLLLQCRYTNIKTCPRAESFSSLLTWHSYIELSFHDKHITESSEKIVFFFAFILFSLISLLMSLVSPRLGHFSTDVKLFNRVLYALQFNYETFHSCYNGTIKGIFVTSLPYNIRCSLMNNAQQSL